MIDRDPIALSACGLHLRRSDGVGREDCPLCSAHLTELRTAPLPPKRHHMTGEFRRKTGPAEGARFRFGKRVTVPAERSIALRGKAGGVR